MQLGSLPLFLCSLRLPSSSQCNLCWIASLLQERGIRQTTRKSEQIKFNLNLKWHIGAKSAKGVNQRRTQRLFFFRQHSPYTFPFAWPLIFITFWTWHLRFNAWKGKTATTKITPSFYQAGKYSGLPRYFHVHGRKSNRLNHRKWICVLFIANVTWLYHIQRDRKPREAKEISFSFLLNV